MGVLVPPKWPHQIPQRPKRHDQCRGPLAPNFQPVYEYNTYDLNAFNFPGIHTGRKVIPNLPIINVCHNRTLNWPSVMRWDSTFVCCTVKKWSVMIWLVLVLTDLRVVLLFRRSRWPSPISSRGGVAETCCNFSDFSVDCLYNVES